MKYRERKKCVEHKPKAKMKGQEKVKAQKTGISVKKPSGKAATNDLKSKIGKFVKKEL